MILIILHHYSLHGGVFKIDVSGINQYIGKTSFGVYLFHDNMFRDFFWKEIFKVESFYYAEWYLLILHIVGCTVAIYLIGTIIELIRTKLIEEPIFKIKKFDKWFEKIDRGMEIE